MFKQLKEDIDNARKERNATGQLAYILVTHRERFRGLTALEITHQLGMSPTYVTEVVKYFRLYDTLKKNGIEIPQK